jgi:metallophosphoesterase superfamily enzyme
MRRRDPPPSHAPGAPGTERDALEPAMYIQNFDTLYVISDLHMGGETGFQIFNQGDRLRKFIGSLADESGRIGLVVNGDIVDFLRSLATAHEAT